MKKILSLTLCLIMVLGLLAGCNGGNDDPYVNPDGKTVITIGIPQKTTVLDYEDNAFTKWLEAELDVDIRVKMFATGDYKTQFSGMLLKGDKLPDILWNFTEFSGKLWDQYGDEDYLVDLKPYMDDKTGASKVWWDRVEGLEPTYLSNILKKCEDDEGRMFVFPYIETSMIDTMDYMACINQQWLDECELEQPTNIDEFYNVLKVFKEKMCAGKQGYYPLAGGGPSMLSGDVTNWIINMFLYFDDRTWFGLSEDGQTLTTPFTSDKYREALAFCKKLIDEGLLIYNLDRQELMNMVNHPNGSQVGIFVGHPTLTFEPNNNSIDNYVAMNNYWSQCIRTEDKYELSAAITTDCADPDLAFELLMLASSLEGGYRLRYGERGVDWDWAEPGSTSFMGIECDIKVMSETLSLTAQKKSWLNGPGVMINAENESVQYTAEPGSWIHKRCTIIKTLYDVYTAQEANNPHYILPVMVLSEKQSEQYMNERTNTQNAIYMMRSAFIEGTRNDMIIGGNADINNPTHWQKYLDALEREGLSLWKSQMQEIYDNEYKHLVLGN